VFELETKHFQQETARRFWQRQPGVSFHIIAASHFAVVERLSSICPTFRRRFTGVLDLINLDGVVFGSCVFGLRLMQVLL
jgi:hypothetical protein